MARALALLLTLAGVASPQDPQATLTSAYAENYPSANDYLRDAQRAWLAHRDAFATLVEALHAGQPDAASVGRAVRYALTIDRAVELAKVDKDAREQRGDDKP